MIDDGVILLVEDNEDDAALALRVLKSLDPPVRVHHVTGGIDALAWLEEDSHPSPSLMLLDLKMTLMSGVDVLNRLRSNPRTRYLPVVMLTSSREMSDIARCYAAGANSFVVKPVDFVEFRTTIQALAAYWVQINRRVEGVIAPSSE